MREDRVWGEEVSEAEVGKSKGRCDGRGAKLSRSEIKKELKEKEVAASRERRKRPDFGFTL